MENLARARWLGSSLNPWLFQQTPHETDRGANRQGPCRLYVEAGPHQFKVLHSGVAHVWEDAPLRQGHHNASGTLEKYTVHFVSINHLQKKWKSIFLPYICYCIFYLLSLLRKRNVLIPCVLRSDWDAALHPSAELFQRHGEQPARYPEGRQERRVWIQLRDDDTATFAPFAVF